MWGHITDDVPSRMANSNDQHIMVLKQFWIAIKVTVNDPTRELRKARNCRIVWFKEMPAWKDELCIIIQVAHNIIRGGWNMEWAMAISGSSYTEGITALVLTYKSG